LKENRNLRDIITKTLADLSNRGYRATYINHHSLIYRNLQQYCSANSINDYSVTAGERFLAEIKRQKPHLKHHTMNEYRMTVRRLNCILTGTEWRPFIEKDVPYTTSCYDNIVKEYEKYLYRKGKTKADVRSHVHTTARFLKFIEQQECLKLSKLTPKHIFSAFKESTHKLGFRGVIGAFLQYAYKYKLIEVNLSLIVPGMLQHIPVPTVYSPEEIEILLESIDRQTELGKRNYAMILIAARLGLRACDIAAMKFGCLHLNTKTIEIVQVKTKQPLTLPLLDDVKYAIYDYINNARPHSSDEQIFLNGRGYGAILPQTISAVVQRAFEKSSIDRKDRKRGSHSLRSSLASALLAEGYNYPTIQKVLGHKEIQSTRSYVKADIEKLRLNALSVPPLAESYEKLLAKSRGAV